MCQVVFDPSGYAVFPTKQHGEIRLSKIKWDKICSQPERGHLVFNADVVATTLVNPDQITRSRDNEEIFFYSKSIDIYRIRPQVKATPPKGMGCLVIVVNGVKKRFVTAYPTNKTKVGTIIFKKKE